MTKKIEITPFIAERQTMQIYNLLAGNSFSTAGPSKAYLMSGTVPFNANGLVPWGYDVVIDPENGTLPTDPVTNPPRAVTPGTYTGSSDHYGLGLTSAITLTVAENNQINLQVDLTGEMPLTPGLATSFLTTTGFGLNVNWITTEAAQEPITITANLYDPANLLVTWNNKKIYNLNYNGNPLVNGISTYAAAATSSGIATWFFIQNGNNMIAGTVGLTGSGADLELDDVNIVQGKTYGISNLRFQSPTSFTY